LTSYQKTLEALESLQKVDNYPMLPSTLSIFCPDILVILLLDHPRGREDLSYFRG